MSNPSRSRSRQESKAALPVDAGARLNAAVVDAAAARFSVARTRLHEIEPQSSAGAAAALLLVRIELRHDVPSALRLLVDRSRAFRTNAEKGEASVLQGVAHARLGDSASATASFARAERAIDQNSDLSAELTYERASAAWIERKLSISLKTLDRLPERVTPDLSLRASILRGAIASAREDLHGQGALLLAAHDVAGDASVLARAVLASQLASLAVELPGSSLRDVAEADAERLPWTEDIAPYHFDTLRSLAWRHALDGDDFAAFRRLKAAGAVAPTPAWRVAAFADRAYLADALGERRWAAQERRDAHELARTVDWRSSDGEEKLALPQLAQLFATDDPAVATHYASTFAQLRGAFSRTLSSRLDARVEALEAYSLGHVQAALGDNAEAERLLRRSIAIYERLGILWRAARARLDLAVLHDDDAERRRAVEILAAYPRCWLLRGLDNTVSVSTVEAAEPPEATQLTPAQRVVYEMLLAGSGTQEIATKLGRSTFTIRNHIKAIFNTFGVSSRPALLATVARFRSR